MAEPQRQTGNVKRLAIIGASVRAAAESAVYAGFDVVAADLFADEDLRACCPATKIEDYPYGFEAWLAEQDVDGWMYSGALENYPELLDRMAAIRPLYGNWGQPLRRCRDPLVLQELFTKAGIGFPETRTSAEGLPLDGSWLCKTYRGANGSGVWPLDSEMSLQSAENADAYYQQHLEGAVASALFAVSAAQKRLLGYATQHLIDPAEASDLQYLGALGPWCVLNERMLKQFENIGNVLCELQLTGVVGVDLIVPMSEEVSVLEINPRWTASVELGEAAASRSFMPFHVAACRDEQVPRLPNLYLSDRDSHQECTTYAKSVLYAKSDIEIAKEFTNWALETKSQNKPFWLADIPAAGTEIKARQPVTTVMTLGAWLEGYSAMQPAIDEVEQRLYLGNGS